MGTNIHCAIERRVAGRWRFDRSLPLHRNYILFGILGGYAGFKDPITRPRGLPLDRDAKNDCTCPEDDPSDYHLGGGDEFGDYGDSWLSLAELRAYDWETPIWLSTTIPLREVDWQTDRRVAGKSADEPHDTYETHAVRIPARQPIPVERCSEIRVLDLRLEEPMSGEFYLQKRVADRAFADRLLADPGLMPPPIEPPHGAIYQDESVGRTWGWKRGEKRPTTAWALVDWQVPAREACPEMHTWILAQGDAPGDDVRILFGFDS